MMDKKIFEACKKMDKQNAIMEMLGEKIDFTKDAICDKEKLVINTGKFLDTMCEMNEVTRIMNDVLNSDGEDVEIFREKMKKKGFMLGFNDEFCKYAYTYNFPDDNDLSRDIIYNIFYVEGDSEEEDIWEIGDYYALIEIHTGTKDARNGFSDKVAFKITDVEYFYMGCAITGSVDSEDKEFEFSYQIMNNCEFDKEKQTWFYKDKEVRLHTLANGF